jgi:hypothetical protein
MESRFKMDKNSCLQIEWLDEQYYVSIFSQDFFSKEAICEERKHGVFYNAELMMPAHRFFVLL